MRHVSRAATFSPICKANMNADISFVALFKEGGGDLVPQCRKMLKAGRSVAADPFGRAHAATSDDPAVLFALASACLPSAVEEELFHLFVEAGADVDAVLVTERGCEFSALSTAAACTRPALVRLLLAAGADVNAQLWVHDHAAFRDALLVASSVVPLARGQGTQKTADAVAIVHTLLAAGARVRMRSPPNQRRAISTALSYACDETIDALDAAMERDRAAGLLDCNLYRETSCLHFAVWHDRISVCARFLDEGASAVSDMCGDESPMYNAQSVAVVHLLLGAGASPGDVAPELHATAFTPEALTAIADGGWQRRCAAVRWWFFIRV